jgi:hypothetical protein
MAVLDILQINNMTMARLIVLNKLSSIVNLVNEEKVA